MALLGPPPHGLHRLDEAVALGPAGAGADSGPAWGVRVSAGGAWGGAGPAAPSDTIVQWTRLITAGIIHPIPTKEEQ